MKKILVFLICLVVYTSKDVYAASYNMSLTTSNTSVKVGDQVNIALALNNVSGISNGLNACQVSLSYSGLSIDNIDGNGWNITDGSVLIMDSSNSISSSGIIANIKATVNNTATITLSNIVCSDGEDEFSTANTSLNFSIKKEDVVTTNKVIKTTKKAVSTTTTKKIKSLLKSLSIDGVNIDFNKNNYDYSFKVLNDIEKLNLDYILEYDNSNVEVIGNSLVVGENNVQIIITNGEDKTVYNLNVIREDVISEVNNTDDEIINALKQNIDVLKVKLDINDTNFISSSVLEFLKTYKKDILYEVYDDSHLVYSIKIFGKNIDNTKAFSLNISFDSFYKNNISKNLKDNNYKIINFIYRGDLPKDTEVRISNLEINNKMYLYSYNNTLDKLDFISKIDDDMILRLNKTSEFVISSYYNNFNNILLFSFASFFAIMSLILIIIIIYKNIKNKSSKAY